MLLGQIRLALGDVRGALDAFRSAFEVADRFGNRTVVLGAFWTAIQALSACEAYGPAAVCIGIAEKSHFVLFNPWTQSPDADHHARACEATRAALGDDRYNQLVSQGAAMSYDDAIIWVRTVLAADDGGLT